MNVQHQEGLRWPGDWKRTKSRQHSLFGRTTLADEVFELADEVRRFGGKNLVITADQKVSKSGQFLATQKIPKDVGVAIYFERNGKRLSMAADKYFKVEHNVRALTKTIEALRTIDRHGSGELLERAAGGYAELPSSGGGTWWQILRVGPDAGCDEVRGAYRAKQKELHPDNIETGDEEAFKRLRPAYDQAMEALGCQ